MNILLLSSVLGCLGRSFGQFLIGRIVDTAVSTPLDPATRVVVDQKLEGRIELRTSHTDLLGKILGKRSCRNLLSLRNCLDDGRSLFEDCTNLIERKLYVILVHLSVSFWNCNQARYEKVSNQTRAALRARLGTSFSEARCTITASVMSCMFNSVLAKPTTVRVVGLSFRRNAASSRATLRSKGSCGLRTESPISTFLPRTRMATHPTGDPLVRIPFT